MINQILNGEFNYSIFYPWISFFIYFLLFYTIFYTIVLVISMYKLFIKEGYKGYYAFIPLYNMYIYFKIAQLPFIYFFVPIINIVMLILIPYNLSKIYGIKDFQCYLALLFPYVFLPYIAFSDLDNKTKKVEVTYEFMKSKKDIDELENTLKNDTDDNSIQNDNDRTERIIEEKNNNTSEQNKIDIITYSKDDDEYIEEDNIQEYKPKKEFEKDNKKDDDSVIEIDDEQLMLNNDAIEVIDEEMEKDDMSKINLQQDIKDFKKEGPSVSAVAFGGKEEKENLAMAKKEEHVCPRCNSPLVGTTDRCPGCGLELKEIFK